MIEGLEALTRFRQVVNCFESSEVCDASKPVWEVRQEKKKAGSHYELTGFSLPASLPLPLLLSFPA
ncbi:MAG: hypothetical protein JWO80_6227 [Bryobacterales bacterium]|nr:hypothetical protein [Bryobacterales bacterium]